jgi:PDZ domain/Peptidase family S41
MRMNPTRAITIVFAFFTLSTVLAGEASMSYLEDMFKSFEKYYLYSKNVDWPALKSQALETAKDAKTIEEAYPAVHEALETIADLNITFEGKDVVDARAERAHLGSLGFRVSTDLVITEIYANSPLDKAGVRVGDLLEAIDGAPLEIAIDGSYALQGKTVELDVIRNGEPLHFTVTRGAVDFVRPLQAGRLGRVAYLEPGTMDGFDFMSTSLEAKQLQQSLHDLETSGACGFVIDARRDGGNMVAKWLGFASLLPENLAQFRTNSDVLEWKVTPAGLLTASSPKTGSSATEGSVNAAKSRLKRPQAPVALLMDGLTFNNDSLIPFLNRDKAITRFLGRSQTRPSLRYWTINLSNSRDILNVPWAQVADGAGHDVEKIEVDQSLEMDYLGFGTKNDHVIQAAQTWLESQSACK